MIITACYPTVYATDLEASAAKYEEMGFHKHHTLDYGYFKLYVMKLNEYRVDLFTSDQEEFRMEDGAFAMRINVKNYEEGLAFYENMGYSPVMETLQGPSFQLAILVNEKGNRIFLFHHIETSFSFSD